VALVTKKLVKCWSKDGQKMVKSWSKGGQIGGILGVSGEKQIIALPLDKKEYLCSMFL